MGDDIVISVMEVRGDAVRIGIQAPRTVTVHREEVYRELQRANRAAAESGAADDDAVAAVTASLQKTVRGRQQTDKQSDTSPSPQTNPPDKAE